MALEEITLEKQNQERCLTMLTHALQSGKETTSEGLQKSDTDIVYLSSKYQLIVSSTLMTTLPCHFPRESLDICIVDLVAYRLLIFLTKERPLFLYIVMYYAFASHGTDQSSYSKCSCSYHHFV